MTDAPSAFYERAEPGVFVATEHTAGPWDAALQHGGPPCSLLARELDAATDGSLRFARLSFELLGPIPVAEVRVDVAVTRPGRRVQMVEGSLSAGGRVVIRARAWQVAPSPAETIAPSAPPPPPRPEEETPPPPAWSASGYINAIEWRFAVGGYADHGPATAWTRARPAELVAGEPLEALSRVLLVADSGNGISSTRDLEEWYFINPELTVHVLRPPRGAWVCLDAETAVTEGGPGLASSTLSDDDGPVAFGRQSLLVEPR
jgi:hypothetical protein